MAYLDIHDYGIIGDMQSCALVGLNGSIDWACFPQFDSPSCFAAILDDKKGGRFSIAPKGEHTVQQRYLPNTNVLETTFTCDSGVVTVVDFMATAASSEADPWHEIERIVRGVSGAVEIELVFQPRLDYARGVTELSLQANGEAKGVIARKEGWALALGATVSLSIGEAADGGGQATASFLLLEGDTHAFSARYGVSSIPAISLADVEGRLQETIRFWEAIVGKIHYEGLWKEEVIRSFLVLHLLMYQPTGAVIAAATTSLPERIGGIRNWDYRFTWLRDAAWTVGALFRLGDREEGEAFMEWMVDRCSLSVEQMQVLYGIRDDSAIYERELEHLEGYKRSRPVRIGNDAAYHRQLDVFGEVVGSLFTYNRYHGRLPERSWQLLVRLADLAAKMWRTTDRSIWEVRGPERHFVYSKLMCWVALERAADLAEAHDQEGKAEFWRQEAAGVKEEILTKGWSEKKQSFVQHYDADTLDASALIMPFLGFLPPGDPRIRSTIKAVQRELANGPFVHRYLTEETDDGLQGGEGCFYMLSFWLMGALLSIGEQGAAQRMFDEVRQTGNHLGLFAEMVDADTKTALGNFPQAFSHIGLIHTARNLSNAILKQQVVEELSP